VQNIRMRKKLLMVLMCMFVLVAGCSKKPLKNMTMGQVRQLVFNWNSGKLPEQQVEGADEIRKELEVFEKQLKEQEVEDREQLDILWTQISKQKSDSENEVHFLEKQYRAAEAETLKQRILLRKKKDEAFSEYCTSRAKGTNEEERMFKRKFEIANQELKAQSDLQSQERQQHSKKLNLLRGKSREQWEAAKEKHTVLKQKLDAQRSEFYHKISPLNKRLASDYSVKTFYKMFGEPRDNSLIGDNYYFKYRCKDGIVVLEIPAANFDYDHVVIMGVSVL